MKTDYASCHLLIGIGFAISLTVLAEFFFSVDIDSDWFWFLAGLGFVLQGVISFRARRRFYQKYKTVKRQR